MLDVAQWTRRQNVEQEVKGKFFQPQYETECD